MVVGKREPGRIAEWPQRTPWSNEDLYTRLRDYLMEPAPHPEVSAWLFRIGHDLQLQRRNRDTHRAAPSGATDGTGLLDR